VSAISIGKKMGAKKIFQALFFCPYFFACFAFNLRVLRALRGAKVFTSVLLHERGEPYLGGLCSQKCGGDDWNNQAAAGFVLRYGPILCLLLGCVRLPAILPDAIRRFPIALAAATGAAPSQFPKHCSCGKRYQKTSAFARRFLTIPMRLPRRSFSPIQGKCQSSPFSLPIWVH
jgi:hypothetical protein